MRYKIFRELESASTLMGAISLGYSIKETTVANSAIVLGFVALALVFRVLKGEKPNV